MYRLARLLLNIGLTVVLASTWAHALDDHLRCYQIKDPLRLGGTVDISTPQFGVATGCKISKAKLFCVPADKTAVDVVDKKSKLPILPLPLSSPPAPGDRICYAVKCKDERPPDVNATDQFGNRTIERFKEKYLCTPAVKGAEFCGDGVANGDEQCDGADDGLCPGVCQADCTCSGPVGGVCETACCYMPAGPGLGACVELTGSAGDVAGFSETCLAIPPVASTPPQVEADVCASTSPGGKIACNSEIRLSANAQCPVCGDNIKQIDEACDGIDDAACPGRCLSNCACAECGNDEREIGEECDGSDANLCPTGVCDPDCTCTDPDCGNDVKETGEECDGADADACQGLCLGDCTCPLPVCGNDVIEQGEDCDPPGEVGAPAGCFGERVCLSGCTCSSGQCGNGLVDNPSEECDGNDAAACGDPRLCTSECTCIQSVCTSQQSCVDTSNCPVAGETCELCSAVNLCVDLSSGCASDLDCDFPQSCAPVSVCFP